MTNQTKINQDISWIKLPSRQPISWHSVSFQYGAGAVAAEYCGLPEPPPGEIGQWAHGWIPKEHQIDPEFVIKYAKSGDKLWVARKDEETYLKGLGYPATAIGLPLCYTRPCDKPSRSGTLLFLPPHSSTVGKETWKEDELGEHLSFLTSQFDQVVACVHSHCFKMGNWVNTFKKYGIPVVSGGDHQDANSLQRMRDLFSQFEFVSTNQFGSAIAYASACGAKVSVSGPFVTINPDKYRWASYYQDHPGAIEKLEGLVSEPELRRCWPELFVPPHEAESNPEWGKQEIGWDCKLSPEELRQAFDWDKWSQTKRKSKYRVRNIVRKVVPKPIRTWVHDIRSPDQSQLKWAALDEKPDRKEVVVDGRRFHFTSAPTFKGTYKAIFERHFYRIPVVIAKPTILDCGANIGLATRYWLEKYPEAEIIAFEPDPELFDVLSKNCHLVPEANVTLHRAAVWNEDTTLSFASTGLETGAVQSVGSIENATSIDVPALDLATFLDRRIDFLKMDIEGAECDVIPSLDGKLQNVLAMYIEYHSYEGAPQRLADIIMVLEKNGFRHAINTNFASKQPMRKIEGSFGMDMRLDIWAWK